MVQVDNAAAVQDGCRIEDVVSPIDAPHHHTNITSRACDLVKHLEVVADERRLEQQVFGRVARQGQLGNATSSAPISSAQRIVSMILSRLPGKSPTVGLIWAKASRKGSANCSGTGAKYRRYTRGRTSEESHLSWRTPSRRRRRGARARAAQSAIRRRGPPCARMSRRPRGRGQHCRGRRGCRPRGGAGAGPGGPARHRPSQRGGTAQVAADGPPTPELSLTPSDASETAPTPEVKAKAKPATKTLPSARPAPRPRTVDKKPAAAPKPAAVATRRQGPKPKSKSPPRNRAPPSGRVRARLSLENRLTSRSVSGDRVHSAG